MKPGAPVDRNLAAVDQISPAAQAMLRVLRHRGILSDCHAAPVQHPACIAQNA
jgi:predicted deacylase